ncbi:YbhB/YbcL family Raf kinase inhibitor-like protein [Pseudolactococcus insecticola]|uniref:Phosphatidylethanolamine-binding protein n=1 Tax=Pseudolactococcus insecticola TaxID=2709158 RepID=A0A6A0BA44_9LACT|nr:YbhB/YbcL family Raf kinase inhibitor-like protein [Lactococcus insecticola]GFH41331.1 phosphatidylethanolamine-binding protein [Lactococcus insecticola]
MKIIVKLDDQGLLPDQYGKYAADDLKVSGHPILSFPFELVDVPADAQFLSWSLVDYDAVPVAGFPWIHWLVADVPVTSQIAEDFSRKTRAAQGKNSNASRFLTKSSERIINRYTGPSPPNETHDYQLIVYAHKDALGLQEGFYLNDLMKAVEPIALAQAKIYLPSRS